MYCLYLRHKFFIHQRRRIGKFIRDCGFEQIDIGYHVLPLGRETKEDHDPDQMVIRLTDESIHIMGDIVCYRGKKSCRKDLIVL